MKHRIEADQRKKSRYEVSVTENISVRLIFQWKQIKGKVISISPGGLAAYFDYEDGQILLGEAQSSFSISFTSEGMVSFSSQARIIYINDFHLQGKHGFRVGFKLYVKKAQEEVGRNLPRFQFSEFLAPSISFANPLFLFQSVFAKVVNASSTHILCETSARNNSLLPGLKIHLNLIVPLFGTDSCEGEIIYYLPHHQKEDRVVFAVRILSNIQKIQGQLSSLLLASNPQVNSSTLKSAGFFLQSFVAGLHFKYAMNLQEREEIAKLRLKAWQKDGFFLDLTDHKEMFDSFDKHSRHLIATMNGRIVAAARLVYNEGDASRCEHKSYGAEIPDWLWKEGFVETSRLVTDPDYRGGDIFLMMTKHIGKTVLESGYKYMVSSCEPSLESIYVKSGCRRLSTFHTPDSDKSWRLLLMDVEKTCLTENMDPISWNVVQSEVTHFLLYKGVLNPTSVQKWRIRFYSLFSGFSKWLMSLKYSKRNQKTSRKINKKYSKTA